MGFEGKFTGADIDALLKEVQTGEVVEKYTEQELRNDSSKPVSNGAVSKALQNKANIGDISNLQQQIASITPIEINGDVVNAADEEDIASIDKLLKLKDRAKGVARGYKIARVTKPLGEQLYFDNDKDTIVEVRYAFDLGGDVLNLPDGCTLKFEGGIISNGTIKGNGVSIIAGNMQVFRDITFDGHWIGSLNALWVGATPNDENFDNSAILNKWATSYYKAFKTIVFPSDTYYFTSPVDIEQASGESKRFLCIDADNSTFRVNISTDDATFLTIYGAGTENFSIKNVKIYNARRTYLSGADRAMSRNNGLFFKRTQLFSLQNVMIENFDKAITLSDVYYGSFVGNNALMYNRIGVYAIGGEIPDVSGGSREVNTIDYGNLRIGGSRAKDTYWRELLPKNDSESDEEYEMRVASCGIDYHCCSNNSKFNGLTIETVMYGMRFNSSGEWKNNWYNEGLLNITDCYFENNKKYDIYIGKGYVDTLGNDWKYVLTYYYTVAIERCLFHMSDAPGIYLSNVRSAFINSCKLQPRLTLAKETSITPDGTVIHNCVGELIDLCGKYTVIVNNLRNITPIPSNSNITEAIGFPSSLSAMLSNVKCGKGVDAIVRKDLMPHYACSISDGSGLYRHLPDCIGVSDAYTLELSTFTNPRKMRYDRHTRSMRVASISGGTERYLNGELNDNTLCLATTNVKGIPLVRLRNIIESTPTIDSNGNPTFTMYIGYARQVFPYKIYVNCRPATASDSGATTVSGESVIPEFGYVYSSLKEGGNVVMVGFSFGVIHRWDEILRAEHPESISPMSQLLDKLVADQGGSSRNKDYVELSTFNIVRYFITLSSPSLASGRLHCDLLNGGRTYRDIRKSTQKDYYQHRFFVTSAAQKNDLIHINAMCFNYIDGDPNKGKYEIFNGIEWEVLDDKSKRFEYSAVGSSIKQRAILPDAIGQSYFNAATGIVYTFDYLDSANKRKWIPSIGRVDSLDTPNGYTSSNNLSYAEELTAGEQVVCNGRLYEWNGTQFIIPNASISRPSLSTIDAGYMHYDRDLSKPIWWDGEKWTDATGLEI